MEKLRRCGNFLESSKPYFAMISLQFGYAGMNIITKVSLNRGMSHYVLVVYRHAFATAVIAPFALIFERRGQPKITFPVFMQIFILALLGPVIDQNFYYAGLKYTSPTFSCAMSNMLPAMTFVMAVMCRMEKINVKKVRCQAKIVGTLLFQIKALSLFSLSQMESETEQSPKTKMESLRTICDREVLIQQQKIDSFTASFPTSLHSIKALALDTAQNHAKLAKLKAKLREAEDGLVKVLAAKTRKEAKQMATRDSISAIKARVEELKRTVQVQRARRDEYGAIISQQSLALSKTEEEAKHETEENGEIQEALSWYNRVLGFQIEGGHGVKFTFNNINIKNPKQEYSFTIRLANDAYSLLECDPQLNGIQELINELNRTNGLFKFVRIMREKFQEAAALGLQPQFTSFYQDYSTISMSGPALSVSTDRSESSAKKNEHHIPLGELNRQFKKVNHGSNSPGNINENQVHDGEINIHPNKVAKSDILSPFVRRSPRLKAKN